VRPIQGGGVDALGHLVVGAALALVGRWTPRPGPQP
jgi:hypothetical protein